MYSNEVLTMADIRERVAEQLKKWQALDQLLEDDDIYTFLQKQFSSNGNAATPVLDFAVEKGAHVAQTEPTPSEEPRRKNDFMAAVEAARRLG